MAHAENPIGSTSQGVLARLAELQREPLIPSDNPLMALGAILSGFSSGMKGTTNPVLERLQALRQQDLSAGLQTVGMNLNIDTARESARQHHVAEAGAVEDRATKLKELSLQAGNIILNRAMELGDPKMARAGWEKIVASGQMPDAYNNPNFVEQAAKSTLAKKDFRENAKEYAARAVWAAENQVPPDPELLNVAPSYIDRAGTPEGRAGLLAQHSIPDAATFLAKTHSERMDAEFKIVQRAGEAEIQKMTGSPISLEGRTPESLATLAMLFEGSGKPVPKVLAKYLDDYRKKLELDFASKGASTELAKVETRLKVEAEKLMKENASVEELAVFVKKIGEIAAAAESANYAGKLLAPDLAKGINALAKKMKALLVKRLEEISRRDQKPGGPLAPAAKPKSLLDELREEHLTGKPK